MMRGVFNYIQSAWTGVINLLSSFQIDTFNLLWLLLAGIFMTFMVRTFVKLGGSSD